MKNSSLRARRGTESSIESPEYASHPLEVDLQFDEPQGGSPEWTLRVCTTCYEELAADTVAIPTWRKPRRIVFHLQSVDEWEPTDYYFFVFRKGQPYGWAVLNFANLDARSGRTPLRPFEEGTPQLFFLAQRDAPWWEVLQEMSLAPHCVRHIVDKLSFYGQVAADGGAAVPYLLVAGPKKTALELARGPLARYAGYDLLYDPDCLLLCDIASGACSYPDFVEMLEADFFFVLDLALPDENADTTNFVSMFAQTLLLQPKYARRLILCGSNDEVERLCENNPFMKELLRGAVALQVEADEEEAEADPLWDQMLGWLAKPDAEEKREEPDEGEEAMEQLEKLVGLTRLKKEIGEATLMADFLQERRRLQLETQGENRHHMVFLGNPGTGKTTVAKLIGRLYHRMGVLSQGHTVVADRTQLVGEYIGQTEKLTKDLIETARGGVLFIDEAYTLVQTDSESRDFGKEALHALLAVLSEPNPDLIVVLAGYEDKMERLFRVNPGLRDRFPLKFHFDDFSADELMTIAHRLLDDRNFRLTPEADSALRGLVEQELGRKDPCFGNGRWVHNLIEHGVLKAMARRVMAAAREEVSEELFSLVEAADVEAAGSKFFPAERPVARSRIGFLG